MCAARRGPRRGAPESSVMLYVVLVARPCIGSRLSVSLDAPLPLCRPRRFPFHVEMSDVCVQRHMCSILASMLSIYNVMGPQNV